MHQMHIRSMKKLQDENKRIKQYSVNQIQPLKNYFWHN